MIMPLRQGRGKEEQEKKEHEKMPPTLSGFRARG
jgi:hypothetical protein